MGTTHLQYLVKWMIFAGVWFFGSWFCSFGVSLGLGFSFWRLVCLGWGFFGVALALFGCRFRVLVGFLPSFGFGSRVACARDPFNLFQRLIKKIADKKKNG